MNKFVEIFVKYDLPASLNIIIDNFYKDINSSYVKKIMHNNSIPFVDSEITDNFNNRQVFYQKTMNHIYTVNYLGHLFNLDFHCHDLSKFDCFIERLYYFCTSLSELNKLSISINNWVYFSDYAKKHHRINNKHHPEYWSKISLMPEKYIIEMICDWHATSIEGYITPSAEIPHTDTMNYYLNVALPKYNFVPRQQKLITEYINLLKIKTDMSAIQKIWQK